MCLAGAATDTQRDPVGPGVFNQVRRIAQASAAAWLLD